jgi:hypothetical protein
MHPSKERRYSEPVWWTVEHTVIWEEHLPSLRADFQRRAAEKRRAQLTRQGPDDVVVQQGAEAPRNVDVEHAHVVGDNNWEVGTTWEQIEPALRYGVGVRAQYPHYTHWTDELDARLRREWEETNPPSTWEKVKRAVRRGFESTHEKRS